jgi:hypothetical protein
MRLRAIGICSILIPGRHTAPLDRLPSALAKYARTCNLHHEESEMVHQRADDTEVAGSQATADPAKDPESDTVAGPSATEAPRGDADTGSGVLLARLAALSLLPTFLTSLAAICFLFFTRTPDGRLAEMPLLALGLGGIGIAGLALQMLWVIRTTRGIVGSVERLVGAIDDADGTRLESLHRRPDWEIALLYRRVRTLLATREEANEEYQALLHAHRQVEAASGILDRIATGDAPGDAGGFTGFLAPIGTSLRALLERLDRRDAQVGARVTALQRAVSEVADEVTQVAARFEGAFMGLLEVVATLKDGRLAVPAIERELERVGHARAREMVGRLGERIDEGLDGLGQVSSRLEASATDARRLAHRGSLIARAADQATAVHGVRASRSADSPGIMRS